MSGVQFGGEVFVNCDQPRCRAQATVWRGDPDDDPGAGRTLPPGWTWRQENTYCPRHSDEKAMRGSYPGGWFGPSWGAPVNQESTHLPTPVGDLCVECTEPITEDDSGMLIPFAQMTPAVLASYHLPCFLATILPRRG